MRWSSTATAPWSRCMALPDMTIPIGYALSYPDVLDLGHLPRLDLAATAALTFEAPDLGALPVPGARVSGFGRRWRHAGGAQRGERGGGGAIPRA